MKDIMVRVHSEKKTLLNSLLIPFISSRTVVMTFRSVQPIFKSRSGNGNAMEVNKAAPFGREQSPG